MHGDLTNGDEQYAALMQRSASYRKLHDWVYSTEFIKNFLDIFDEVIIDYIDCGQLLIDPRKIDLKPEPFETRSKITVNSRKNKEVFLFPRLDLGIGRLNYGKEHGGSGIHVDNLTRLISILVYIDENPSMVGGEHRLYALESGVPKISRVYRPEANLMIASLQSNFAFHDVNPVRSITGVRKALYMAVSCSTELWRPHADASLQRLTKNRYRPSGFEGLRRKFDRAQTRVIGKINRLARRQD